MPEVLKIPIERFQVKPNSTSIFVYDNFQYTYSGSGVKRELRLLTDGKIIARTRGTGNARYKCNMKPKEVLLAKAKSEEESKRAAELTSKKKAGEEVKPTAELTSKKKAEEEAKRAAELTSKKKAEEEAKRAAELASKKKAEEEAKTAQLQVKINLARERSSNFYNDINEFVKSGGDLDLLKLSDLFERRPNPESIWTLKELTNFESLETFVRSNNDFDIFEDTKITERKIQFEETKKDIILSLNDNLDKLNSLFRENFSVVEFSEPLKKNIKKIQSLLDDIDTKFVRDIALNTLNESTETIKMVSERIAHVKAIDKDLNFYKTELDTFLRANFGTEKGNSASGYLKKIETISANLDREILHMQITSFLRKNNVIAEETRSEKTSSSSTAQRTGSGSSANSGDNRSKNKIRTAVDAITIAGLNWGMEPMKSAVEQKGYRCKEESDLWGASSTVCRNGNKRIGVHEDILTFNCAVFNGCGYKLRELAENAVNKGIVSKLDYESENIWDGEKNLLIEKYCGRGKQGDMLCVVEDKNMYGQPLMGMHLMKGSFGKGGVSFN